MRRVRRLRGRPVQPVQLGADLPARWKAFLNAPAADGEPTIPPAKVPAVKPLVGQKRGHWATWYRRVN